MAEKNNNVKPFKHFQVRIRYEATMLVDFDINTESEKNLKSDDIYELARYKSLMMNKNNLRIGDELSMDMVSSYYKDSGEPIEHLLEMVGGKKKKNENDNDGEEEGEEDADVAINDEPVAPPNYVAEHHVAHEVPDGNGFRIVGG